MNEFLHAPPFDLYELQLFRLVVQHRSFTKAAQLAGLTQSAITRQIQGMEASLGLELLERTTRSVRSTPAGEFLFHESARLIGDVEASLQRLREQFAGARQEVRVGISRSIGHAYLPGFFHANLRRHPQVACRASYQPSADILAALEANDLDLGVLCPPPRLPQTVRVTHRFEDTFTLLASRELAAAFLALPNSTKTRTAWLLKQNWLLIDDATNTGRKLRGWMKRQGLPVEPTMQMDGFDPIINLVALGLGISLVPIRALALYGRKQTLRRLPMRERFVRELVVVVRRHRKTPAHVAQFVANVLF
ncbi:MAG: LysR family transcriptional regulator [Chthoniobacter sp.]|uniref:LysR family transcriptional regulator n=1 Tax=Chthoniobacter sp. TaxID=2510640 RepID=UPI0032A47CB2